MSRKSVAEKFQNDVYNITVTGRNVAVTDAMEQYAIEKVQKIDRFSNRVIDVNVIMDIQKLDHRVDITMQVGHLVVRSSYSSDNIYTSIDKAIDRLKAQLLKYKDRLKEYQNKGNSIENMQVKILDAKEEGIEELNEEISSENTANLIEKYTPHHIVSEETRPLKTLNASEAVMKMELSGDTFLVYRSEEDRKLKVIYRRNDGNYGIIEPEK